MELLKNILFFTVAVILVSCNKNKESEEILTPKFEITPISKDFENVQINTTSSYEFTIGNKGEGKLKLTQFVVEGENEDFSTDAANNTTIPNGGTYTFKVTFAPKSTGSKTATLKITHNAGSNAIALSGSAFSEEDLKNKQDAWVFFKDKPKADDFLSNPSTMLSAKALERRAKQGIDLDEKDVPIEESYYNTVKSVFGITVLAKSKWLNAIHIQAPQFIIETLVNQNDFISKVEYADKSLNNEKRNFRVQKRNVEPHNKFEKVTEDFTYGETETQIKMLKADVLHKKGFTGKGIVIAVIDAGFPNVNTLDAFKRLRDNNQILGGYDFVERNTNFYVGNAHGTHVLSTIAGYIKSSEINFVGTAPNASFYLFRTENANKEEIIEESLWVEAAEKADSLGIDIINTSLGYNTFDNAQHSHTYADLNGKTAFISKGAEIAASRGMIVINAAGNEGDSEWKYVNVPADAASVLAVGAVTKAGNVVNFSSKGPTFDGRIKPDVSALGSSSAIIHYTGTVVKSSGTSFASPITAGAVACLWQAYPNKTASEIIQQIKKGSHKYKTPDNNYGYGIPDFEQIFDQLKE